MMSLRFCVLFLALAASSLAASSLTAKTPRLPILAGFYNTGSLSNSITVISSNTILVPSYSMMSSSPAEVRIRSKDTPPNDSGEIYRVTRILYDPNSDPISSMNSFVVARLDRDIELGKDRKAPIVSREAVVVPEGQVCTTVRRSYDTIGYPSTTSLKHQDVVAISSDQCRELNPEMFSDDKFICIGPINPNGESPDNECQGDTGAPLVCDGQLVGINSCGKTSVNPSHPRLALFLCFPCRDRLLRPCVRLQENLERWRLRLRPVIPIRQQLAAANGLQLTTPEAENPPFRLLMRLRNAFDPIKLT
ncbi:trypsin-like [Phlebotomus argentipes]|uniref:trypsin-like n=1 Tax=Phlebotomus argentipes TaxID=94469 RepID=UPI002892CB9A|nr:trypsin-like [Phlebotomus argentipes]